MSEIKKVNSKNTKTEILDAYQSALEQIKNLKETSFSPSEIKGSQIKKAVLKEAKEIIEKNILKDSIVEKYNNLVQAIELKEKDIKNLYDIEIEINSLAALIKAKDEIEKTKTQEYKTKIDSLQETVFELEEEYKEKKEQLKKDYDSIFKELEKQKKDTLKENEIEIHRLFEQKEYDTNKEYNRLLDDLKTKAKEARKELAEIDQELNSKSNYIETLTKENEALTKKVAEIPAIIVKTQNETTVKVKNNMQKDLDAQKTIFEKEISLEKMLLQQQLEAKEKEMENLRKENEENKLKLEKAYAQMNELSIKTVQATRTQFIETKTDK